MVVSCNATLSENKYTQDVLTFTLAASDVKFVNYMLVILKFVGSLNVSSKENYFSLQKFMYFEVM